MANESPLISLIVRSTVEGVFRTCLSYLETHGDPKIFFDLTYRHIGILILYCLLRDHFHSSLPQGETNLSRQLPHWQLEHSFCPVSLERTMMKRTKSQSLSHSTSRKQVRRYRHLKYHKEKFLALVWPYVLVVIPCRELCFVVTSSHVNCN